MGRASGDDIMDREFENDLQDMQKFQAGGAEQSEETMEDFMEDQFLKNKELMGAYGAPEPEEKMNPSTFLHKAAFSPDIDVVRATFLAPEELGRPLFTTRFMMKMEDVAMYYLDDLCKQLNIPNKIAMYFRADIRNTAESGMSNKGFIANLNVTRRMDATRRRIRTRSSGKFEKGGEKDES